jgi:5-methylcytosine-specific restriction endonuclease McrA
MEAWFGQPIPLELDHRNGDSNDNRLENLRLLCPNCHAQTPNFRVKKDGAKSVADVWEKGKD